MQALAKGGKECVGCTALGAVCEGGEHGGGEHSVHSSECVGAAWQRAHHARKGLVRVVFCNGQDKDDVRGAVVGEVGGCVQEAWVVLWAGCEKYRCSLWVMGRLAYGLGCTSKTLPMDRAWSTWSLSGLMDTSAMPASAAT